MKKRFNLALLIIFFFAYSCGEPDSMSSFKFTTLIVNDSNHNIEFMIFGKETSYQGETINIKKSIVISSKDTLKFEGFCSNTIFSGSGCDVGYYNFFEGRVGEFDDSAYIVFDNDKVLKFYYYGTFDMNLCPNILLGISGPNCGYLHEKVGETEERNTYTITEEDYENAKPIEN